MSISQGCHLLLASSIEELEKNAEKNRSMSGVGISEVGDADLREFLLKTIVAKKLTMNVQGNNVTIPRALK